MPDKSTRLPFVHYGKSPETGTFDADFQEAGLGEVRRIPLPRLSEKGSEGGYESGFGLYEEAEMGPKEP